jgi:drug/metabolite transporter (DMT)-like permease
VSENGGFGARLFGALNAVAITGYNYFIVKTSQTGPYTVLLFLAITSVIVGVAINILVIVIPLLNDITMLHAVNNCGILILSAVLSYIFFKERITRLNLLGCAVMCAALVLVVFF